MNIQNLESEALRRIFGLWGEEVTGGRRKLHSEEIYYLYSSRNTVRVTKSRRLR
jgi:hypothetical protein